MDDSTFDLHQFQQKDRQAEPPAPRRASRRDGDEDRRFLRGPVPLPWLLAAGRLPTRALHAAVALAFLSGVERTRVGLRVSPKLMREFGLDRFARYRALKALEAAGLITIVERTPGRAPVVTLRMDDGVPPAPPKGHSP